MLELHTFVVTPFAQNCRLLVCAGTGAAAVIDPGEAEPVLAAVAQLGVAVTHLLATHGHIDHIAGAEELRRALRAPFYFPPADDDWRLALPAQAAMFGLAEPPIPAVDRPLQHGDRLAVGRVELEVLHCPGHTPGHVCFHCAAAARLFSGDVLFQGSVGRTDFPGGSFAQLQRSIRGRLYALPPATVVHCGHGPDTTIGAEAAGNPFVPA